MCNVCIDRILAMHGPCPYCPASIVLVADPWNTFPIVGRGGVWKSVVDGDGNGVPPPTLRCAKRARDDGDATTSGERHVRRAISFGGYNSPGVMTPSWTTTKL